MQNLVSIDFHGATLIARHGNTPATTLVAMKPVVEGMHLNWDTQRRKIVEHPILGTCAVNLTVQLPGDIQHREVVFLPLNRLNFWLATIQPNKVPAPETRARIIRYQEECADVLFAHFFGQATGIAVDIQDLAAAVAGLRQEVAELRTAYDPRIAVLDFISVRELLDQAKALPKGRNGLNRRIGNALRRLALKDGVSLRQCPRTGTWLFPAEFGRGWMRTHGAALVRQHNGAAIGQGVLRFPDRRARSPDAPDSATPSA